GHGVGVAAGHHLLRLEGGREEVARGQGEAQEGVRGHRSRHRGGRAASHAPGQGQALLDLELEAGRGPRATQDGRRGDGGGVPGGAGRSARAGHRPQAHAGRALDPCHHPVALARERDPEAVEAGPEVGRRAGRVGGDPVHGQSHRVTQRRGIAKPAADRPGRRSGTACYDRAAMASLSLARPRLLDRYILREMVAPMSLGVLVFTFILLIDQIPRLLAILVARSADFYTIVRVFLNLLPSILAVTIPMALLLGVLLAFGRLASDSEIVALRAVGVSPLRLLGPVFAFSLAAGLLTFYINAVALPAANQAHRELVYSLIVSKARTVVKPRTFTDELL